MAQAFAAPEPAPQRLRQVAKMKKPFRLPLRVHPRMQVSPRGPDENQQTAGVSKTSNAAR
jgi:hypothetical protein